MPRLGAARTQARRRQILDAALACFARDGFAKATMRDVMLESGLSPGSIYSHFASKDAIIAAVVNQRHQRDQQLLQGAAVESTLPEYGERLVRDFLEALDTPGDRRWGRLAVQLWAESLHHAATLEQTRNGLEMAVEGLSARIAQAQERGELPPALDPAAFARVVIALFQGLVLQSALDPGLPLQSSITVLRQVLKGIQGMEGRR